MTRPVNDLVAYLAGEPGDAADRGRRALADPGSDLSLFLASARERTRTALAEPAFRGLGLSPAACLPPDLESPPAPPEATGRNWLPWVVAGLALLVAGLAAWAPWRAARLPDDGRAAGEPVAALPANPDPGPAPTIGPAARQEEQVVPVGPNPPGAPPRADKPAANKAEPAGIVAPGGAAPAALPPEPTGPRRVDDPALPVVPGVAGPAKKAGDRPAPPVNPAAEDPAKTIRALRQALAAAEATALALANENRALQTRVAKQAQDAKQAQAECESRLAGLQGQLTELKRQIADLQRDNNDLRRENAKLKSPLGGVTRLQERIRELEEEIQRLKAQPKAPPPIGSGSAKPVGGPGQPSDTKPSGDKKKP